MQISDIKSDINFLVGATSATYLDADKIRNVNIAYQDVARLIWSSAGGWQYDDSNNTTLPIGTTSMVNNQQDYAIPTTAQRMYEVEVKSQQGTWMKLKPIDMSDMSVAHTSFMSGQGLPMYYDLIGRSVMLYPIPNSAYVTLSAGLRLTFDRDVNTFAVTATSTVPGFPVQFHRMLSYAAAIDYTPDYQMKNFLSAQRQRLENGLIAFYASRSTEALPSIKPQAKKFWRQYI